MARLLPFATHALPRTRGKHCACASCAQGHVAMHPLACAASALGVKLSNAFAQGMVQMVPCIHPPASTSTCCATSCYSTLHRAFQARVRTATPPDLCHR